MALKPNFRLGNKWLLVQRPAALQRRPPWPPPQAHRPPPPIRSQVQQFLRSRLNWIRPSLWSAPSAARTFAPSILCRVPTRPLTGGGASVDRFLNQIAFLPRSKYEWPPLGLGYQGPVWLRPFIVTPCVACNLTNETRDVMYSRDCPW